MTETPTSAYRGAQRWARLAAELGINASIDGPPIINENSRLDVIKAELLLPNGEDEAIVILRVKTRTGRILEFDMSLGWEAIVDATDDYDEVDGELDEREFNMTRPDEVERYFGRRRSR